MYSCFEIPVKREDQCAVPGCFCEATLWPYEKNRNVRFCDKHARKLIVETVKSIADGTHPDMQKES